jgi:hypothetical protein
VKTRRPLPALAAPRRLGMTAPGPGGSGPGNWVVRTRLLQGKDYAPTMAEMGR